MYSLYTCIFREREVELPPRLRNRTLLLPERSLCPFPAGGLSVLVLLSGAGFVSTEDYTALGAQRVCLQLR